MLLEDVHPHHCLVEVRVQGLDDLVVEVLLRGTATGYTKMTCSCCICVCLMYVTSPSPGGGRSEMGDRGERGYARVPYLILESVEPLEDELKEGVQVVWAR